MAWVVKTWRTDPLRQLAEREVADAEAHLRLLEDLGRELRDGVRERRRPQAAFKRSRLRESPLAGLFRSTEP